MNRLNVRRVRIETIDRDGKVENVTYGIIAADDNASRRSVDFYNKSAAIFKVTKDDLGLI